MNSVTPFGPSKKRGCIGGGIASCGTADAVQNKPSLKRGNFDEETEPAAETRWYSAMLRAALGRWSRKSFGRSPGRKVARIQSELSSESILQDSTNATNNNCKKGSRCDMHENSPCRSQRIFQSRAEAVEPTNDNSGQSLCGHKLRYVTSAEGDAVHGYDLRVQERNLTATGTEKETPPAGASGHGRSEREKRPKSDGILRQKLAILPYRDCKSETKDPAIIEGSNSKHRSCKRKQFHSPIHKKENLQDRRNVQSTYVSFQDDIADDMYTNVKSDAGILSAAAGSPAIQRSDATTDSLSQISPSSLADDVFTDGFRRRPASHESSGLGNSAEELQDDRIAKLFHRVSVAFEKSSFNTESTTTSTSQQDQRTTEAQIVAKVSKRPDVESIFAPKKLQGDHVETIMASANLHASLDNALCILDESTKLLSPNNNSVGWSQASLSAARHQLHTAGFFQPSRPRTYSACSRLEPIAEENDRNEETLSDHQQADVVDTASCTFSESSEYEKFSFPTPRSNSFVIRSAMNQKDSNYSASSVEQAYFETKRSATAHKDLDPKLQWLINASGTTPRSNSISTISVQSLHRKNGLVDDLSTPTKVEKCAACEWTRRIHQRAMVSVIPNAAWKRIVNDSSGCSNHTHFHPWGVCTEKHNPPVLCHSHYLQYYQHLQNDHKVNKGRRHLLCTPTPAQPDSIIDYDIHKVLRDLDDLPMASVDGSYGHLHRTKQSDTDMSVNSDSAFSTNGSPTPSTRDGANTDGEESIEYVNERSESDGGRRNDTWTHSAEQYDGGSILQGKRTQSCDDTRSSKDLEKCSTGHHSQRYSLVSSLCSFSQPLTPDAFNDSAVHLQECASSQSTHLSSESFFNSGTFFGDRETCLIERALKSDVLSRSSSEASLQSEGTLCLSEFAMSQQNITLLPASSFPRISELCSPKKAVTLKETTPANETEAQFEDWVKKAKLTESVLESFLNSSLAQMQSNAVLTQESTSELTTNCLTNHHSKQTDTLTSSSGSSDTNTLGSGSGGSTYTASSLRSYGRFNTFGSSSCISTDDTGETVIDQYMSRSNRRLRNIEEIQSAPKQHRLKKKRSSELSKMRYQSSTFHYKNLEAPCFSQAFQRQDITATSFTTANTEIQLGVSKDPIKATGPRSRSSSMSCMLTSLTKAICVVQQSRSLPCIYLSQTIDKRLVHPRASSKKDKKAGVFLKPLSPTYGPVLQKQVRTMMQNYSDIDNIIASLRESLKSSKSRETDNFLDQKVLELGNILKQKDKMINQLHCMLLACSMPKKRTRQNYQLSATM